MSTDALWGCYGTSINGADGTVIGTGNQNTLDILAECTEVGIAAKLCADLSITDQDGTVYTDWYLPSLDELIILYNNRVAIGGFNLSANYWSSTEAYNTSVFAWMYSFNNNNSLYIDKDISMSYIHVRAIRAF